MYTQKTSQRKLIAVVMGGVSPEHNISVQSGCSMIQNLDTTLYIPFPILISKENKWHWPQNYKEYEKTDDLKKDDLVQTYQHVLQSPPSNWKECLFPNFTDFPKADLFLLGLHGKGGEDGAIQGFLELCNQPYTGSNIFAASQSMDKFYTKEVYKQHHILTPHSVFYSADKNSLKEIQTQIERDFSFPVVAKDPHGGSSLGVFLSKNSSELEGHLHSLHKQCHDILVEEYIHGREASCGYMQGIQKPFPPTEICISGDGFFDHQAKYQGKEVQEITPGEFDPELTHTLQLLAQQCHEALNLSGVSRTDFLIKDRNNGTGQKCDVYAIETNSLPGFTEHSLIPQQAKHIGFSISELLTHLIKQHLS
jgi:D-alanine-D-alanine ligase